MRTSGKDEIGPARLLRTPEPFEDESLMGYVLRLTDENGYDATSWIFNLAGLKISANSWYVLYRSACDTAALRRVLGLTPTEYDALMYVNGTSQSSVIFSDQSPPAEFIRFSAPRVCPTCLREADYYRRYWDLLPLTSCPTHGLVFIDSCPGCGRRISWVRKKVSICRCGYDWRTSRPVAADADGLEVSRHALRLCLRSSENQRTEIDANPIYGLGLEDFCRALTLLAGYQLFIESNTWVQAKTENEKCHRAYSYAYRAFTAWPASFNRFLLRIKRRGGRRISGSKLYSQIEKCCDTPSLRFMYIACEDYVEACEWNAPRLGITCPPTFRRFIDRSEACRRLGIEQEWLDPLIEKGELVTIPDPIKSRLLIDAASVELLHNSLCRMSSLANVAVILGAEAADAEDLIHEGLLRPLSGPTVDGLPEWRFDRRDVIDLLNRLERAMAEHSTAIHESLMAIRVAIHQMKTHGYGPGRCLRAILEGEIVAQETLPPPYRHIPYFVFVKDCVSKLGRRHMIGHKDTEYVESGRDEQFHAFNYKVKARALERRRSRNLRSHPRRTKRKFTTDVISSEVPDLVRVARNIFISNTSVTIQVSGGSRHKRQRLAGQHTLQCVAEAGK